jgi:hypothetical protein
LKRSVFLTAAAFTPSVGAASLTLFARAAVAQPAGITLVKARVKFFTSTDNKDPDSGPKVHLFRRKIEDDAYQIGYSDRLGGAEWLQGTPNGPFEIHLFAPLDRAEFYNTWTLMDFVTKGKDRWDFDYHLKFLWSDNNVSRMVKNGITLDTNFGGDHKRWYQISDFSEPDTWPDDGWANDSDGWKVVDVSFGQPRPAQSSGSRRPGPRLPTGPADRQHGKG